MGDPRQRIAIHIDASSESIARQYAAMHSIDVTGAKWSSNPDGKDGRLFVIATPSFHTAKSPNGASVGMSGAHGVGNQFSSHPVCKILRSCTE